MKITNPNVKVAASLFTSVLLLLALFLVPARVKVPVTQARAPAQDPADYALCAGEGGRCQFTGTKTVKYGANGKFVETVATNWFDCNSQAFGSDPTPNVPKKCYVSLADFNPWGLTKSEQDCQNGLQGKVVVVKPRAGEPVRPYNLAWSEAALQALCKGTTNAAKTIDCWTEAFKTKDQQTALRECAAVPLPIEPEVNYGTYVKPAGPRQVDFTIYDTDPADRTVTPDESDPVAVEIINQPLSPDDLTKVMKWIADRTASQMSPYCYKSSYGRGAGEPLGCAAGLDKNGQLCYPKCRAGYSGAGPVCYSNCPAGFNDIGALCQKPASYGRGAGYPLHFGEFSLDGARARCEKDNPQGCEQNGALYYPKCKAGFHAVGCCVCSPDCPSGLTDTGTDCAKSSYGRGAGSPITDCAAGMEKGGLLCYPKCKSGYYGNGPVCYQNCPSAQPTGCAAGCAIDGATCGVTTAIMVYSVFNAAYSLFTLGSAAKANIAELKALRGDALPASVLKAAPGVAAQARTAAQTANAGRLTKLYNALKKGGSLAVDKAAAAAERAKLFAGEEAVENLAKAKGTLTQVNKARGVYKGASRLVYAYSDQYARHFGALTSPEIEREINSRFGPIGARQIKMTWARVSLSLLLEARGFETAQIVLSIISIVDPTGVVGVVSAFTHPLCALDTPFPSVTVRYRD
jgi:hypothetical protein